MDDHRRTCRQWGIDTGYVAVRPDAWKTARMEEYVKGFPYAAVARDLPTPCPSSLPTKTSV